MQDQRQVLGDVGSCDRSFNHTTYSTHRTPFGRSRRGSDSHTKQSSTNTLGYTRPSYTCLTDIDGQVGGLHKVQTAENLHLDSYKTGRPRWNIGQNHIFNRPSDLFTTSQMLSRKQSTALTLSIYGTYNNFSNDIEVRNSLNEENQRLKTENKTLKSQMNELLRQIDELHQVCRTLKQQKDQGNIYREDLRRSLEKMSKQIDEESKLTEQARQQRSLYQQIAEKLRRRVDLLLEQNSNLHQALDKHAGQDYQIKILESKYETVKEEFARLQRSAQQDDSDWDLHKHVWMQEKEYYHQIIRKFEFQVECLKAKDMN